MFQTRSAINKLNLYMWDYGAPSIYFNKFSEWQPKLTLTLLTGFAQLKSKGLFESHTPLKSDWYWLAYSLSPIWFPSTGVLQMQSETALAGAAAQKNSIRVLEVVYKSLFCGVIPFLCQTLTDNIFICWYVKYESTFYINFRCNSQ